MNLGILIVLITFLGYIANWINWKFLNYIFVRLLYLIGAFIHELSHALFCLLVGARIIEFKIFSRQPKVVYIEPRLKYIGRPLISLAPIIGGLLFLFLINNYWLKESFDIFQISDYKDIFSSPLALLAQINLLNWQSWVILLLFLNVGAMIGPSVQDLKNIWPFLIIFFFIESTVFDNLLFLALGLILMNILIQVIFIVIIKVIKLLKY